MLVGAAEEGVLHHPPIASQPLFRGGTNEVSELIAIEDRPESSTEFLLVMQIGAGDEARVNVPNNCWLPARDNPMALVCAATAVHCQAVVGQHHMRLGSLTFVGRMGIGHLLVQCPRHPPAQLLQLRQAELWNRTLHTF